MYTVHKWSALVANIWNILTEALLIPFIWFQVPRSTQLLRYTTMCNITLDIVLELHFSSWLQQSMKTWLILGNFYDHDLNLTCFCKRNCKNEIDSKHDQTITKRSRRKICFFLVLTTGGGGLMWYKNIKIRTIRVVVEGNCYCHDDSGGGGETISSEVKLAESAARHSH